MHRAIHALSILSVLLGGAAGFSCLDEDGKETDFWVALKGNSGVGYYYWSNGSSSTLDLSSSTINGTSDGAILATVQQFYGDLGDDYAYAMYNDHQPDGSQGQNHAHSKGILLFDGEKGFWLVHSFPQWPGGVKDGYDGLPSITYGQSFMCMTFSLSELESIAAIQLVQWPYLYSTGVSDSLNSSLPTFASWIDGDKTSTSSVLTTMLKTHGGLSLTDYGKSKDCDCNLWEEISTRIKAGLSVESWQSGRGGKLPNYCTSDGYDYDIQNVSLVKFESTGQEWKNTQDHSKWGVSLKSSVPKVCVGDINRMASQVKRGGGAICYEDKKLWTAFTSIIETQYACGD